jgi:hypothetical protein
VASQRLRKACPPSPTTGLTVDMCNQSRISSLLTPAYISKPWPISILRPRPLLGCRERAWGCRRGNLIKTSPARRRKQPRPASCSAPALPAPDGSTFSLPTPPKQTAHLVLSRLLRLTTMAGRTSMLRLRYRRHLRENSKSALLSWPTAMTVIGGRLTRIYNCSLMK